MKLTEHFKSQDRHKKTEAYYASKRKSSAKWAKLNPEKAKENTNAWRRKNKEKITESKRVWLSKPENRVRHCLYACKKRANESGREFSVTIEDVLPLPEICPILGIKINYSGNPSGSGFVNDSPSIDRIDSSLGYIPGNVRIISWRANRIKSDATLEELKKIVEYMEMQ